MHQVTSPTESHTDPVFCRNLFEHTPISLWEMDYSQVKDFLDDWRANGVTDLNTYLEQNPNIINDCMQSIQVLDVNRKSLKLFQATSKDTLKTNRMMIFRDILERHFHDELVKLWDKKLEYEQEGICYSLSGEPMDVNIRWVILPGCEDNFSHVLVAVTNITARKRAEDHLSFLTHHDALTSLYNRFYYEEELSRLEESRRFPITIIIANLIGLKEINSTLGNSVGNDLLCRAADVLKAAFRNEDVVARTSGNQFAIILPQTDKETANKAIERIKKLLQLNNEFYEGPPLELAFGLALGNKGCCLQDIHRDAEEQLRKHK